MNNASRIIHPPDLLNPFGVTAQELTTFVEKHPYFTIDSRIIDAFGRTVDASEILLMFMSVEIELWSMCYLPDLHHIASFCKKKRIRKKNARRIMKEFRKEQKYEQSCTD